MKKLISPLHNLQHFFMAKMGSVIVLALLTGCTMIPPYEKPPVTVPSHYPTGEAYPVKDYASTKTGAINDIGWRNFYQDSVLQQLIVHGLKNNHDMKVATLNVEAMQAQYRIRRADIFPNLNISMEFSRQHLPTDIAHIPRLYQLGGTTIAWEVDLWGRVRSLKDQALHHYFASKENQIASQLSLISTIATTYLIYKADQECLNLARSTLATQQQSYELIQKMLNAGQATRFDLRQSEMALRTAQTHYLKFLRLVAQDRNALILLIGSPPTQNLLDQLEQTTSFSDNIIMHDLAVALPSELLKRRPDIRAAEHRLLAANANIGAARAAFFPSITLTGSAGTASSSLDRLFSAGTGAWSFIPKINIPVFNAGLNQSHLDRSYIMKKVEVAHYDQTIQQAFREVADGLAGKKTLEEQIEAQHQMVEASQDAYRLANLRFKAGEDNYLAVLDSQRSLYEAQKVLIQTRLERSHNLIRLYKALGGGWQENMKTLK